MARITPDDVTEIIETDVPKPAVEAFVEDAHQIVENRVTPYADSSVTRASLAAVETHLAAHLLTARDPRITTSSHETMEVELAVDGDSYWGTAVRLDPTGHLTRPAGRSFYSV